MCYGNRSEPKLINLHFLPYYLINNNLSNDLLEITYMKMIILLDNLVTSPVGNENKVGLVSSGERSTRPVHLF